MTFAWVTGGILFVLVIGFDIYFAADKVRGNTWTEIARGLARKTPAIPWVIGVIAGHVIPLVKAPLLPMPFGVLSVILMSLIVAGVGVALKFHTRPLARKELGWFGLVVAAGYFAGALLWSN